MGRPRRDRPLDRFLTTELAAAVRMTPRQVTSLDEQGFLPEGSTGQTGFGLHGIRTLKLVAIIGALHSGGTELVFAARLAEAAAEEIEAMYGRLPTNLVSKFGKLPPEIRAAIDELPLDQDNDFRIHRLVAPTDIYQRGRALLGDLRMDLADRAYAFIGNIMPAGVELVDGPESEAAFRVTSWERGGNVTLLRVQDEVETLATEEGLPHHDLVAVQRRYHLARLSALGLLRINISLAIRTALDRLADHRGGK